MQCLVSMFSFRVWNDSVKTTTSVYNNCVCGLHQGLVVLVFCYMSLGLKGELHMWFHLPASRYFNKKVMKSHGIRYDSSHVCNICPILLNNLQLVVITYCTAYYLGKSFWKNNTYNVVNDLDTSTSKSRHTYSWDCGGWSSALRKKKNILRL